MVAGAKHIVVAKSKSHAILFGDADVVEHKSTILDPPVLPITSAGRFEVNSHLDAFNNLHDGEGWSLDSKKAQTELSNDQLNNFHDGEGWSVQAEQAAAARHHGKGCCVHKVIQTVQSSGQKSPCKMFKNLHDGGDLSLHISAAFNNLHGGEGWSLCAKTMRGTLQTDPYEVFSNLHDGEDWRLPGKPNDRMSPQAHWSVDTTASGAMSPDRTKDLWLSSLATMKAFQHIPASKL